MGDIMKLPDAPHPLSVPRVRYSEVNALYACGANTPSESYTLGLPWASTLYALDWFRSTPMWKWEKEAMLDAATTGGVSGLRRGSISGFLGPRGSRAYGEDCK